MEKHCLTTDERAKILMEYSALGKKPLWTEISQKTGINADTIRSFINRYNKTNQINPKRGRPPIIEQVEVDGIIGSVDSNCSTTLNEISNDFDHTESTIKNILNDNGIFHYKKTAACLLDNDHKQDRMNFCRIFSNTPYAQLPTIIFTDESSVSVNPGRIGIWRRRGFHPENSFAETTQKAVNVMVWGAIGPRGFRTPLIKVDGNIDAYKYVETLAKKGILGIIQHEFGRNYVWMHDNAPSHAAKLTHDTLLRFVPQVLNWPPRSPDLNPIENLWDYIKDKLGNSIYDNEDQLFARLAFEWENIPPDVIHDCYSAFLARCIVCLNHNGESLSGKWNEVHAEHNKYRTKLVEVQIQTPNGVINKYIEQ